MPYDSHLKIVDWLRTQERVLQFWRDEMLAQAEVDIRFVERLEAHRSWLKWELDRLLITQ